MYSLSSDCAMIALLVQSSYHSSDSEEMRQAMKVTVCQLNDQPELLERDWQNLIMHVKQTQSDYVLLPEMPFSSWLHWTDVVSAEQWSESMRLHDSFMHHFA